MTAALLLTLLAGLLLLVADLRLPPRMPAYSRWRDTISELGAVGSPNQALVSMAVFFPIAFLMGIVAFTLRFSFQPAGILGLSLAIGYFAAAIFPCEPGAPLFGSFTNMLHNLGGGLQYVGGALGLLRLAESLGWPFQAAGLVVAAATVAISFPGPWRGAIQRVAEICLFGGLLAALWLRQ